MGLGAKWWADQRQWATERCHVHDTNGYLSKLDCNLLQPMSSETRSDFNGGSGGNSALGGERPFRKCMPCTHRRYWLATYLTIGASEGLTLSAKHSEAIEYLKTSSSKHSSPPGLPGQPPNLDVALCCASGDVWGIESKFTEPFGAKKSGPAFKDKYFPAGRPVWSERGLPKSSVLALALQAGQVTFRHLDAAQLLKHALGLQTNHLGFFSLVYLYADEDAPEARQHRHEITEFEAAIDQDFPFVSLSYNLFLRRLRNFAGADHHSYFEYFTQRYRFITAESGVSIAEPKTQS